MQKSRERLHRSPPRTSGEWAGAHPTPRHSPTQVPGPWLSPESSNLPFHPTPNPVLKAQPQYHSRGEWDLMSGDWGKSLNLSFCLQPRPGPHVRNGLGSWRGRQTEAHVAMHLASHILRPWPWGLGEPEHGTCKLREAAL